MFGLRSILTEAPRPEAVRRHPRAPWLAVGVVCFGAFMGQLDASIVTLTFKPMERDFHAPLAAVQWVSLVYLLALVALLAPVGRISDARGRKLVYTYGFVVFTAASAACGLSSSLEMLVGFRFVQAVGAAMLQTNSVALVTTSVPRPQMRLALGVQAGAQSIGLALGPTLGGLLTASVGWRGVYWVNVPVGIVAIVAARFLLPRTRHFTPTGVFDWQGTALLATSTTGLLLGMSAAGGLRMPVWATVTLFVVAAAAGVLFVVRELGAAFPLIPLTLLRNLQLALALVGALAGYLVLFGPLVLVPQVLTGPGQSEAHVGILLSALPVGFGVAALTQEAVLPRALGNRERGALGALVSTAALAVFVFVPLDTVWVVSLLAVTGVGLGVFIPANNTIIMRSGAAGSSGVLGGLVNLARGIGTTLGIAFMTLALHVAPRGVVFEAGRTPGSQLAFLVLAAVSAAGVVISLAGRRQRASGGGPDDEGEATDEEGASGAFS